MPDNDFAEQGRLGRLLAEQGRLEEAIPLLQSAVSDPQEFYLSWFTFVLALIDNGKIGSALIYLQSRPPQAHWTLRFHFLKDAAVAQRFDVVEKVYECSQAGTVEGMIDGFWFAYVLHCRGRHDEAVALFHAAATLGRAALAQGLSLPFIPHFILLGGTLLDNREMAQLLAQPPQPPQPSLEWVPADSPSAAASGPVVLMGCDEGYFLRFAEGSLSGIKECGLSRCHIHLAGCTEKGREMMANLRSTFPDIHLNFTIEPKPSENHLVYYASCRFFHAEEMLQHYQADLIIIDIDNRLTPDIHALQQSMIGKDIGGFIQQNAMPWLVFIVGIVWCNNTDRTENFLRLTSAALRNRFPIAPEWMIDQSVVYCAAEYLQSLDCLTVNNFTTFAGNNINSVLAPLCDGDEKKELRKKAFLV